MYMRPYESFMEVWNKNGSFFLNILTTFFNSLEKLYIFAELNRTSSFLFLIIFNQFLYPHSFLNYKNTYNKKIKLYW